MVAAGTMIAGLAATPAVAAGTSCTATVRATQETDEVHDKYVYKVFSVEISTSESCAKVYVDLVTTERLFDGEEITTTSRGFRKVSAHTTYKVKHQIAKDSSLLKWEFKVHSCLVCGAEGRG